MSDQAQTPVVVGEKREREETADQSASPASVPPTSTPAEAPKSQAPKTILRLKSASKTPVAASPTIASPPSITAPVRRLSGSPLLGLANMTSGNMMSRTMSNPASPTSTTLSNSSAPNASFSSPPSGKEFRFANSLFRVLEADATRMEIAQEYLLELANSISVLIAKEVDPTSTMQTLYPFIKEPANIALRENIIKGVVPPERLVRMSETELMTPEAQEKERAAASRRLMDRDQEQLSKAKAMNSKMFKCGKCHQRDASYYEKQTRSADEPMTLFITCNKCNHLWRIG